MRKPPVELELEEPVNWPAKVAALEQRLAVKERECESLRRSRDVFTRPRPGAARGDSLTRRKSERWVGPHGESVAASGEKSQPDFWLAEFFDN